MKPYESKPGENMKAWRGRLNRDQAHGVGNVEVHPTKQHEHSKIAMHHKEREMRSTHAEKTKMKKMKEHESLKEMK